MEVKFQFENFNLSKATIRNLIFTFFKLPPLIKRYNIQKIVYTFLAILPAYENVY